VVYRTVEKIQFFMVGLIIIFVVYAALFLLGGDGYAALGRGFVEVDKIPDGVETIGAATLLGAIAFAGAGGALNLVQSNWVRDKGLGMGALLPKVVSPFTGEEAVAPTTGYFFERDKENMRRWNAWWKVANREQFTTFFVIGAIALFVFMTLTLVTVGIGGAEEEFDFIKVQGDALSDANGAWLGTAFWLTGGVVLFSTNLAVLDMVGRITADVLKTGPLKDNAKWSESKLYFVTVWVEIGFGSIILLSGVTQPIVLLVIASSLNGLVMFVYSCLLIQLNRGMLPREIGLKGGRLVVIGWAVLFYGGFSVILLVDQAKLLFG